MNLDQMLEYIKASDRIMKNIASCVEIPAKEAVYADFPEFMDERIKAALVRRGGQKALFPSGADTICI